MTTALLFWVGLAVGVGAIVTYFVVLIARPRLVRLINGMGLFLTGLGLVQTAFLARESQPNAWFNANLAILVLTMAALMQTYGALRHRGGWDGVERRGADA
jgi:hypothetical protein